MNIALVLLVFSGAICQLSAYIENITLHHRRPVLGKSWHLCNTNTFNIHSEIM